MLTSLILPFVEYGNHEGYSMKRNFEPEPYLGQSAVVRYLKKCGRERGMSMRVPTDFFSGEIITTAPNAFYADEKYSWNGTLAYYVEKYNLKLPDEFVRHVLAQTT